MKALEINKYPPSLFKKGRFLREDWTSCADVGTVRNGRTLSTDEYLDVEERYIAALHAFMRAAGVSELRAHSVEYWDDNPRLRSVGLGDVLDGSPAPAEGDSIPAARLDLIAKKCLREAAWLELVHERDFLIHFGHDLRVIVAMEADPVPAIDATRALGLFTYDGNTRLETLDAWRGFAPST